MKTLARAALCSLFFANAALASDSPVNVPANSSVKLPTASCGMSSLAPDSALAWSLFIVFAQVPPHERQSCGA